MNQEEPRLDQPVPTAEPNEQPVVTSPETEQPVVTNPEPSGPVTATPESAKAIPENANANSPGIVILGWLTYAFWGWLLLFMSWLAFIVFATVLDTFKVSGAVPYSLAGTLVLLPIAFVTDLFYRRKETPKKTGVGMAVMVIHAVIFALFAIGWLITVVFSAISIATVVGGESSSNSMTIILTGLVATALYAATFLRTLNPFKTMRLSAFYAYGMLGVTVALALAAVLGPLAKTNATRDDRRIVAHLETVKSAVDEYTQQNKKLPDNLANLSYENPDAKKLVDDNLVRYKNEGKSTDSDGYTGRYGGGVSLDSPSYTFRYQLCVTYKEKSSYYNGDSRPNSYDDGYSTYLSIYSHPAGEVCYKLKTESSGLYD